MGGRTVIMTSELISIIVPVYKVEKYIKECIYSIISQTFDNWELILVDDGSPDHSGEICDSFKTIDKRIRVIHKINGGLSDARNCALDLIEGEYITFIDSDDVVSPYYLEALNSAMNLYNADIVQCSLTRDLEALYGVDSKKIKVFKDSEILQSFFRFQGPTVYACGKLYKRKVFQDLRFPFGLLDEDNYTTYKAFYKSHILVYIKQDLYYYRSNADSITNKAFSVKKFEILNCIDDIKRYLDKEYSFYQSDIDYYHCRQIIQLINNAIEAEADLSYEREIRQLIVQLSELIATGVNLDWKYRILSFFLINHYSFYSKLVMRYRLKS